MQFGSSAPSATFGNEPLVGGRDFRVLRVEVWGFVEASSYSPISPRPRDTAMAEERRAHGGRAFAVGSESLKRRGRRDPNRSTSRAVSVSPRLPADQRCLLRRPHLSERLDARRRGCGQHELGVARPLVSELLFL